MKRPYVLYQLEPIIHQQTVPVDDVIIFHDKDKKPKVVVLDTDGVEIEVEIRYPDLKHIRILTNVPIQFEAYIY